MTPSTEEALLSRVHVHLGGHDRAVAERATIAVLAALFDSMPVAEARTLLQALPPGLRARLRPTTAAARGGGQHAVGPGD